MTIRDIIRNADERYNSDAIQNRDEFDCVFDVVHVALMEAVCERLTEEWDDRPEERMDFHYAELSEALAALTAYRAKRGL